MKEEKEGRKPEKGRTFDDAAFNIEQETFSLKGISDLFMGCANGGNDTDYVLDGISILIEGIADRIRENLEDLQEIYRKSPGASPVN